MNAVADLIDAERWTSMDADTGQYFTPRELLKAVVDVMRPTSDDTALILLLAPVGSCWRRTSTL